LRPWSGWSPQADRSSRSSGSIPTWSAPTYNRRWSTPQPRPRRNRTVGLAAQRPRPHRWSDHRLGPAPARGFADSRCWSAKLVELRCRTSGPFNRPSPGRSGVSLQSVNFCVLRRTPNERYSAVTPRSGATRCSVAEVNGSEPSAPSLRSKASCRTDDLTQNADSDPQERESGCSKSISARTRSRHLEAGTGTERQAEAAPCVLLRTFWPARHDHSSVIHHRSSRPGCVGPIAKGGCGRSTVSTDSAVSWCLELPAPDNRGRQAGR
jgi:hypothetical protein